MRIGRGGWIRWEQIADDGTGYCEAYVRFVDDDGRLVPAELYMPAVSTVRRLRAFELASVEAEINLPAVAASVRARLDEVGPQLAVAASFLDGEADAPRWVAEMLVQRSEPKSHPRLTATRGPVSGCLAVPAARPFPESFYADVARVYGELARTAKNPAGAIAAANPGVAVTQVHRWVRVARARGHLGRAHQGKRG